MIEEILRRSREAGEYAYSGIALYSHERLPFPAEEPDYTAESPPHFMRREAQADSGTQESAPQAHERDAAIPPSPPPVPTAPEGSGFSAYAAPGTAVQAAGQPSPVPVKTAPVETAAAEPAGGNPIGGNPAAAVFTAAGLEELGNSLELETLRFSSYLG